MTYIYSVMCTSVSFCHLPAADIYKWLYYYCRSCCFSSLFFFGSMSVVGQPRITCVSAYSVSYHQSAICQQKWESIRDGLTELPISACTEEKYQRNNWICAELKGLRLFLWIQNLWHSDCQTDCWNVHLSCCPWMLIPPTISHLQKAFPIIWQQIQPPSQPQATRNQFTNLQQSMTSMYPASYIPRIIWEQPPGQLPQQSFGKT